MLRDILDEGSELVDLAGDCVHILDLLVQLLLIVVHIMGRGCQLLHSRRYMHYRIIDGLGHLLQTVLIKAHLGKGIGHEIKHLGRGFQIFLWNVFDLAHSLHILLRIHADFCCNLPIFILLQRLSKHLPADNGADLLPVQQNGCPEIHQTSMAIIDCRFSRRS